VGFVPDPGIFKANLRCLREKDPRSFDELFQTPAPPGRLEFFLTPSGALSAKREGLWLHSPRDPQGEADLFIEQSLAAAGAGEGGLTLMEGFGLGYHARAFLRRQPQGELWILEPDRELFLDALGGCDLRDVIAQERTVFLLAPSPEALCRLLAGRRETRTGIIKIRSVYQKDRPYYEGVDKAVQNLLARRQVNVNTLKRFGRLWVRNLFWNLGVLRRARGLYRLEGRLRGLPALILAAGPSLDELLPRLGELKERFVLISLDTSYPAVKEAAGEPDFLVVVDPQYWNTRHLDRQDFRNALLVSESSTHPVIFRRYPGRPFFCESSFPLGTYLERGTDVRGRVAAGGSVATMAWELARIAGASEINCAGLDLGYPGNQTHRRESFFERRSLGDSFRLNPLEHHSYRLLREAGRRRQPNNSGGLTLTDDRMTVYRGWFESQAALPGTPPAYSLSALGVAIEGIPYRDPRELLAYPPARKDIEGRLAPLRAEGEAGEEGSFEEGLRALEKELEELAQLSRRGREVTGEARRALKGGKNLQPLLGEMDRIDRLVLAGRGGNIAGFLFQDLLDSLNGDDRDPLDNSFRLYSRLLESADYHLRLLHQARER
jgi:hypothetical protein